MKNTASLLAVRIPSFEAAVRKAADPRLAAVPVVIVTAFTPRGRVTAACPLARDSGIEEGLHYPSARVRCPDAAFFLPDRRLADDAMRRLLHSAGHYSPLAEPAGAGCVILDIRGTERLWGGHCRAAELLRGDIQGSMRLPAAAGLAVCRPWSLLASRAAGDGGVCHVPPGTEEDFLGSVPVGWIDGLSPRTLTLMLEMNIRSLGQLRCFSRQELARQFGSACGGILWQVLHPQPWDGIPLLPEQTVLDTDAGRVRTEAALAEATVSAEKLRLVVRLLAERTAVSLRAQELGAARLRLTLLHADGQIKSAAVRLGGYIQDQAALQTAAEKLLGRVFRRRVRAVRLILEAEKLAEPQRQGVLFSPAGSGCGALPQPAERERGTARLLAAVDRIRGRFGDGAVAPAALLAGAGTGSRQPEPGVSRPALPRNSA